MRPMRSSNDLSSEPAIFLIDPYAVLRANTGCSELASASGFTMTISYDVDDSILQYKRIEDRTGFSTFYRHCRRYRKPV